MLAMPHKCAETLSGLLLAMALFVCSGCYAPMVSGGIPASSLPDEFRMPIRTGGAPLNYTMLTTPPPADYLLGPNDVIEVNVADLFPNGDFRPMNVTVMGSGHVQLPLVGPVEVSGMNLAQAQAAITRAYANGYFNSPRVSVALTQKATYSVVVLGKVGHPGVTELPRYENDVAHAIAQAGGLAEDAADTIEVHRRAHGVNPEVVTIPLRGANAFSFGPNDVVLYPGDVVVIPGRRNDVFYVVGKLSTTNNVRFSTSLQAREFGNGFLLPRDREIDVVTAVAMAGYIDPIDSPTTVTVQRYIPGEKPLLIRVDLIKARYCREENVNICPGDIVYLNPDAQWYFRRTFDRVIDSVLIYPYRYLFGI